MPSRRAAPTYDWDSDGSTSKQGIGIFILKPEVQAIVRKPSWNSTETVIRPYPCVSFDKPETDFEPYRVVFNDGRNRFSDWIRRYPCAWGIGQNSITFLIPKPHKMYDVWTSPLGVLYKAIENACKKGEAKDPSWYPLREAGMNRGKALRPPGELYLIQGVVMRHDKTEYGGKNGPPLGWGKNPSLILMLSMDAGKGLADELNKEKEGFAGSPNDFEARYVNGDPVSPLHGRFIHFWERGSVPPSRGYASHPTTAQQQAASSFEAGFNSDDGDASKGGAKGDIKKGFDIELTTHYAGRPATFNQVGEEQTRKHWQHWDDILHFPTEVEQAHMLTKVFPASAIIYSFESVNKEWIPDECWHAIRQPKSVNFRERTEFQEPPASDDPFGGFAAPSTPAQSPVVSQAAAAVATTAQRSVEVDPWSTDATSDPTSALAGTEDHSLPVGTVEASAPAEAPPAAPTPPAASGGKPSSEAVIARLANARNKVK